jgi:hypothetical protein
MSGKNYIAGRPTTPRPNSRATIEEKDGLYALSRLRDYNLYNNVRLYLAFLHNQSEDVCIEGKTKTNLKILIQQEDFSSNYKDLYALYVRFCAQFDGITETNVRADLMSFRSPVSNKRRIHLQNARDAKKRYFRP